jgi:FtsH-binding integral membrane protein
MHDITYTSPTTAADRDAVAEFAGRVYGWVAAGLFLSGFTAWAVYSDQARLQSAENNLLLWVLAPFVPLLILMFGAQRLSPPLSALTYLVFCALEGVGLGVIVSYYASESVALALVTTAGVFTTMAVIGTVTKRDLTSMGGLLLVALIGLIIASLANLFFASSALMWVITYAGVAIFMGLTAYDAQMVKKRAMAGDTSWGSSLMCAVSLYLDALNLFLFLLRIFGRN